MKSRKFLSILLILTTLFLFISMTSCNIQNDPAISIPTFETPGTSSAQTTIHTPTTPIIPTGTLTDIPDTPKTIIPTTPTLTPDSTKTDLPNLTPDNTAATDTPEVTPTPSVTPPVTSDPTTEEPPVIEIPLSKNEYDYYLTNDGLYSFSKKHNVVVFLLDRLDYNRILEIQEEYPNFLNQLDGFTLYTNALSEFARTRPGANHILTGYEKDVYLVSKKDFLNNSWSGYGENILQVMNDAGYDVDLFTGVWDMFGSPSKFARLVSNMSWDKDLEESTIYEIDDYQFSTGIKNITLSLKKNAFKFYHFNGPHNPYTLNADGTKSNKTTTRLEQTMGCFQIIFNTLNKMKALGIYESSEIIIVADHGDAISDYKPIQRGTAIGLFHKPSGEAGTALKYSKAHVSHKNIPPTILKAMGVENYSKFGTPLDEVDENAWITRYFYKSVMDSTEKHEAYVVKYSITGDANNIFYWKKIEQYDVLYYFY